MVVLFCFHEDRVQGALDELLIAVDDDSWFYVQAGYSVNIPEPFRRAFDY